MKIDYDEGKCAATLETRRLDVAQAGLVFDGRHLTFEDRRKDYGEPRFVTLGYLGDRLVLIAWTARNDARRIISMRKANERERKKFVPLLGR